MKPPNKTLERKLFSNGYRYVIGVDEVGMGSLAGPVVVCAASLPKVFFKKDYKQLRGVRDSKLLSANRREVFVKALLVVPNFRFQIAYSYPKTIDQLNIYKTARLAMRRAVNRMTLSGQGHPVVLVDGNKKIPGLDLPQLAITGGDRKVFSIACASIIAKVYRDKMMTKYAKKYQQYAFEQHKGYGTKLHQARLAQFGPCSIHRKSFAPVAKHIRPAGL